jgi:DNA repair protein RecN (Recombination protein N)
MLKTLKIRNVAVVPALEIDFGEGFNLLTGETGAGKSILIDALGLLLGTRASADVVRTGEDAAVVEAAVLSQELSTSLEARALPHEAGEEIILRREVTAAGRSRATINGALVPLAVLRELAPLVASIQGQHDSQGLLDTDAQMLFVDTYAGALDLRGRVGVAYRTLRSVESRLADLRRDRRELERRREMVEFQLGEIDSARLVPGEEEALRREKALLANAGRLVDLSAAAYATLYEDEGAALAQLEIVFKRVAELAAIDATFATYSEARDAIRAQLVDLAYSLRDYREKIHASPARLDETESRLALVERLKRKYGASVEEILQFAERSRSELETLASPEEAQRGLEEERTRAAGAYHDAASELSARRRRASDEIARGLREELGTLAMGKTRFSVRFETGAPTDGTDGSEGWSETGLERLEFLLSPNPGEELRPLARIASGGELSRILLALRTLLDGGENADRALVFDEVDAGIGGAVAEVVGRKLRRLSARQQVICITHLPQIAAFADHHFRVRKEVKGGRTVAIVEKLDPEARIEEVARMLGGESISETARRHARELVAASTVCKT